VLGFARQTRLDTGEHIAAAEARKRTLADAIDKYTTDLLPRARRAKQSDKILGQRTVAMVRRYSHLSEQHTTAWRRSFSDGRRAQHGGTVKRLAGRAPSRSNREKTPARSVLAIND